MKKLLFATGGRKIHLNDLQILQDISNELLAFIKGRKNGTVPYIISGCVPSYLGGDLYGISAGLVFLNGKLLALDAGSITVPQSSTLANPSVFIIEGLAVTSSPKQYETGAILDTVTETKAVFTSVDPFTQQFLPVYIKVIGDLRIGNLESDFWGSLATKIALETTTQTLTSLNAATNTALNTALANAFTLVWIQLGVTDIYYCKDVFGYVRLKGDTGISGVKGNLPVGYRPAQEITYSVGQIDFSALTNIIATNGDITTQISDSSAENFPHFIGT